MKKILSIIFIASCLFTSCKKNEDTITIKSAGTVNLTFDTMFGAQDFSINKNFIADNKTFNFSKFRFWVNNIILLNDKGEEYKVPNSYFLIEETAAIPVQDGAFTYPATKRETISLNNIPTGNYKTIKFSIGVESKYNDNLSLQVGELSQLSGMTNISWMWMTSYIFSSIGGKVTEGGNSKNLLIETGLNTNYKSVSLTLPNVLRITSTNAASLVLATDVAKAIDGIDITTNPIIGAAKPSIMADVATNYSSKVFTVKSIQ
jgi:hypothetical protein